MSIKPTKIPSKSHLKPPFFYSAMSSNMFSNGYLVSQTVIIALYIWSFVANEDIQPLNMVI
jgi:hypothetical protein